MKNRVFVTSAAFCFLVSVLACPSRLLALTAPITLTQSLQVGPFNLPPGTEVSYDQAGIVAEALLHAPLQNGQETLPASTRLAFFLDAAYAIVASRQANPATGQPASPMQIELLYSLEDLSQECKDPTVSWLAHNYDDPQVHVITRGDQLDTTKLQLGAPPSPFSATMLQVEYKGDDADLPIGTVIETDSQGNVITIYLAAAGRLGAIMLPQGSIIDRGAYGSYEGIYVHESVSTGGYDTVPEGFLMLAWDGSLAETTVSSATSINPGLTAPSRSRVGFMNGHVHRVDIRVGETVTYFGSQVAAGHSICLSDSGAANILLAADTKIGLNMFPSASYIIEDESGNPAFALLSRNASISGLVIKSTAGQQIDAYFDNGGHIKRAVLAVPAAIGGIRVQDEIETQGNGYDLKLGTLVNDQVIDGVPCLGGKYIELNSSGHPVSFTASATYQIGSTVLQRGQPFLGTFSKQGTQTIFDGSKGELANALQQLQTELISKASSSIMSVSSKFPFGNISAIQDHDFVWNASGAVMNISQQMHVGKLFTNPPFGDCDADLKLDATVTWTVVSGFMKQEVVAWPASLSVSYKHGICPGTAAIETIAGALSDLVPKIRELIDSKTTGALAGLVQKSVIQKVIGDTTLSKAEQLIQYIQALQGDGTYVPNSFRIDSVLVENGNLNLHYSYTVSVQ